MPTLANITVKKADGTTDVIYTALVGAGADGTPSRHRAEAGGQVVGWRPLLTIFAKPNTNGSGRSVTGRFKFPVVRSVGGVDTLIGTVPLEISGTVGNGFTQSEIDEAVAQGFNLFSSVQVRDSFKQAYAPR